MEITKKHLPLTNDFMAIDPGVGGTGIAVFGPTQIKPSNTYVLDSGFDNYYSRVDDICNAFNELIVQYKHIETVIIEKPQFYDTGKGRVTARSEALYKLCFIYGRLYQLAEQTIHNTYALPIPMWKGQMPKTMVNKRIAKITGRNWSPSHIADAVGMGLFLKGLM